MPEDITPEKAPNQPQPIESQVNEAAARLHATVAARREERSILSTPDPSAPLPEIISGGEIDHRIEESKRATGMEAMTQDTRVFMDDHANLPEIPTLTERIDDIPTLTERIDERGMDPALIETQLRERQGRAVLEAFGYPKHTAPEDVRVDVSQDEVGRIARENLEGGSSESFSQGNDAKVEIANMLGQVKALSRISSTTKDTQEKERADKEMGPLVGKLKFLGIDPKAVMMSPKDTRSVLERFGLPRDPNAVEELVTTQGEFDKLTEQTQEEDIEPAAIEGVDANAEIARLQGQAKALATIIVELEKKNHRTEEEQKDLDRAAKERARVVGTLEFLGAVSVAGEKSPVMVGTKEAKAKDQEDFKRTTPEQKEAFGLNVLNMGHKIEEWKSRGFRTVSEWAGGKFETGSTMAKFFAGLSKHYAQKEEVARTGLREIDAAVKERGVMGAVKKGGIWQRVRDTGLLLGNVTKWGRNVGDALGLTVFLPTRWFMLGSQVAATGIGTAKEVRLGNEAVIERNRIQDIEEAAQQAWAIYERAMKNKGLDPDGERTGISGRELSAAYRERLPQDLIERISRDPKEGVGLTLVDRLFRPHIEAKARGIQGKLDKVDAEDISPQERAKKKQEILLRFGRSRMLHDFDRMLAEQGTIDALAAAGHMGERIAQGVVYGMMAETWTRLIYDRIADSFSALGEQPAPPGEITTAVNKEMVEQVVAGPSAEGHFADAHAGWSAVEHSGIGAEHVPLPPYIVESGDSFYRIIAEKIPEFRDMGPGQMQNHAMANFLGKLSGQELESIGVKGGNPQVITPGELLDIGRLQELLHEKTVHGMNIIEEAARHYGASEAIDVSNQHVPEAHPADSDGWTETVEPIAPNAQAEAFQAKVDMIGRYTNDLIPQKDFEGHQALWNETSVKPAGEFLASAPTTADEVLLQKRMYSLSELTKLKPSGFENVQEFLQRAFEKFIDMSGVNPEQGEKIDAYLERATEAYLRTDPTFKPGLPR